MLLPCILHASYMRLQQWCSGLHPTLQHAATRCNTLQHAGTHCNVRPNISGGPSCVESLSFRSIFQKDMTKCASPNIMTKCASPKELYICAKEPYILRIFAKSAYKCVQGSYAKDRFQFTQHTRGGAVVGN